LCKQQTFRAREDWAIVESTCGTLKDEFASTATEDRRCRVVAATVTMHVERDKSRPH
jgi:hypothetical protein